MPQPTINSLNDWLITARSKLEPITDTPFLEAQMLASFVLSRPKSWLLAHPEAFIESDQFEILNANLDKLAGGYPLAYITGEREFFGRQFTIRTGVLIPRPETELLVETAVEWLNHHPTRRTVADIGCGSGCIGVSLAAECSKISVYAVDIDPEAVHLAELNAKKHHVDSRVNCLTGDLMAPLHGKFDLICANLPYIPSQTLAKLTVARFEPLLALDGGVDGLRLIELLLVQAKKQLSPGGMILLEIETSQGESAQILARQYLPQSGIRLVKDLAEHPRLLIIQT